MRYTFKSLRLLCVIIFCFYCSNLLALEDILKYDFTIDDMNESHLKECIESRAINFKDRSHGERISLIYLNAILNKILSANQSILNDFGRSLDEFCVDINHPTDIVESTFASVGNGLIYINLLVEYTIFKEGLDIHDYQIAASIAHEIAHDLLEHEKKHKDKQREIYEKYFRKKQEKIETNFKNKNANIDPDLVDIWLCELLKDKWNEYYINHPDFIKMQQKHEIEADNLGLRLYLNTDFNIWGFGNSFISNKYYYNNPKYYPSIPDIFRVISQDENYADEGAQAKEEGRFDEFMDSIKYIDPQTDTHPSDFWRYWNATSQVAKYSQNTHKKLGLAMDSFYFKIDLSKSKRKEKINAALTDILMRSLYEAGFDPKDLDILLQYINDAKLKAQEQKFSILPHIAAQYSSRTYTSLPSTEEITNPKVYLLTELLNTNSEISLDITSHLDNVKDLNTVNDKGILTIKANNLYRIMVLAERLSNLTYKSSCSEFFTLDESGKKEEAKLKEELKNYIIKLL